MLGAQSNIPDGAKCFKTKKFGRRFKQQPLCFKQGTLYYQSKQCTIIEKFSQDYHTFLLFDSPLKRVVFSDPCDQTTPRFLKHQETPTSLANFKKRIIQRPPLGPEVGWNRVHGHLRVTSNIYHKPLSKRKQKNRKKETTFIWTDICATKKKSQLTTLIFVPQSFL